MSKLPAKPLEWVASSKKELLSMPGEVVDLFGYAIHLAQCGGKHTQAKPLKGFGSAGVLEVVEDDDGNPIVRSTPCDSATQFMSCIVFRKNRIRASLHQSKTWI